jgi:hypothetical protein
MLYFIDIAVMSITTNNAIPPSVDEGNIVGTQQTVTVQAWEVS